MAGHAFLCLRTTERQSKQSPCGSDPQVALTGVAKLAGIVFLLCRREHGLSFENQFGRGLTLRDYRVYASRLCQSFNLDPFLLCEQNNQRVRQKFLK